MANFNPLPSSAFAYAQGQDAHFSKGISDPSQKPALAAHELTHVIQQGETPANQENQEAQASTLEEGDQNETQAPQDHESPANLVEFGIPETQEQQSETIEPLTLQSWSEEESVYADPAVAKLMEFVRDLEDKNFQQMMDMMQQSLDRAREMMQQAQEHWNKVELPKKQAGEEALRQIDSAKAATADLAAQEANAQQQSQQLEALVGAIQSQVQNNPDLLNDAANSNLQSMLNAAQQIARAAARP